MDATSTTIATPDTTTTVRLGGPRALTAAESKQQLAQCEEVIEKGLQSFVEVGLALMTIRDRLLYRDGYGTFENYCHNRWGFTRQRAHQLIQAAKITPPKADSPPSGNGASTIVDIQPRNEAVARELNKVPEADREDVWARAIIEAGDPEKVTAKLVKAVAEGNGEGDLRVVSNDDTTGVEPEERKMRGVAVIRANEAVNALARIPKNDPLRKHGFQLVSDWIKSNRGFPEQPSAELCMILKGIDRLIAIVQGSTQGIPVVRDIAIRNLRAAKKYVKAAGHYLKSDPERTEPVQNLVRLAQENDLAPDDLVDAAKLVLDAKREGIREREAAKQAVRRMTGLDKQDVDRVQNAGFDFTSAQKIGGVTGERLANFDVVAHEAAREYPELGIGNPDDPSADHAAKLWEVLGEGVGRAPQLYDKDLLDEAVGVALLHPREPEQRSARSSFSAELTDLMERYCYDGRMHFDEIQFVLECAAVGHQEEIE